VLLTAGAATQVLERNLFGQSLFTAAYVLAPLALAAIYGTQARQSGWLGAVGFVLAFAGTLVSILVAFMWLAILTRNAAAHDALMAIVAAVPGAVFLAYGQMLGIVLLGIATARAGVFPRWAGLLVATGMLVAIPSEVAPGTLLVLWPIGTAIMSAGIGWMGCQLIKGSGESEAARAPVGLQPATA
jgi:hypothetical protein